MPEVLTRITSEIDERIKSMRPLVDEYHRLQAALDALENAPSTNGSKLAAAPAPAARPRARGRKRKHPGRGASREKVVRALRQHGPSTAAQLSQYTQLTRQSVYGVLRLMQEQGLVSKTTKPSGIEFDLTPQTADQLS